VGPSSWNDGAGAARVYTLAGIIRYTMPYLDPGSLTDEEAQQVGRVHHVAAAAALPVQGTDYCRREGSGRRRLLPRRTVDWGRMIDRPGRRYTDRRHMNTVATAAVIAALWSPAPRPSSRGGAAAFMPRIGENPAYDGAFMFCRIMFRNASNGDGGGWYVDYPRADQNLSFRFSS
jgi:hypothetical protein